MNKKSIFISTSFIFFILFTGKIFSEISSSQQEMLNQLPPDQRESILAKMNQANKIQSEIEQVFEKESTLIEKPENSENFENGNILDRCEDCIFGYEFFKYSPSTFIQSSNFPVPASYILGPGDKLQISYFGNNSNSQESYISRNGDVLMPLLGPVNLAGMTFQEATKFLSNKVNSELIGTDLSVSVSELRSISVYLLGEAYKPGLYTMSSLSSISNALFVAGGVNEDGSLRHIELKRGGELIGTYDFYDFLIKGNINKDLRLMDGDIIFIPFIKNRIKIDGAFKRPAIYEFKESDTLADAVDLAGGYKSNVPPSAQIELSSIDQNDFSRKLIYLPILNKNLDRKLVNEDTITISSSPKALSYSIKLTGEFNKPGVYSFNPGDSILDLIRRAGGYTDQAYTQGAVFLRDSVAEMQRDGFNRSADQLEQTLVNVVTKGILKDINESTLLPITSLIKRLREIEPLGRLVVDVDMLTLKSDPIKNLTIENGDILHIPTRPSSVSIVGEVLNTSSQYFYPEKDVFDYIDLAGGLSENADSKRIFIIYPNGQSKIIKKRLFASRNYLLPGSSIMVTRLSRPLDGVNLAQIVTPILADLATSAAAIAAISD